MRLDRAPPSRTRILSQYNNVVFATHGLAEEKGAIAAAGKGGEIAATDGGAGASADLQPEVVQEGVGVVEDVRPLLLGR